MGLRIGRELTLRPPSETDIHGILALIAAADVATTGEADPWSEDDVRGDWIGLDPEHDAWVIEAPGGMLVGYALVGDRGYGHIHSAGYVHPAYMGQGIGTALLGLIEARARELAPNALDGVRVALQMGTLANDSPARHLLERSGFAPVRYFWRMRIDMTEPPPVPVWPAGVSMRTCVLDQDERMFYTTLEEAFQDHWGHDPEVYEEWLARTVKSESFDPSLWFLALEGAEPAGALRGRVMADGSGWVNVLGVRRPWRRKRLGMALLLHSFETFYQRGIRDVALGVDAQSPTGATHLYEAAGMRVVREFVVYEKVLRPGIELSSHAPK